MKFFCLIGFMVLGLWACNDSPDVVVIPDYRSGFEGRYIGVRVSSSWSLNGPSSSSTTADTVDVVMVGDSSLLLDATELQIGPNGQFYEQGNGSASSYFSVEFFNGDSLETDMNGGGLGGGYHSNFKGRKM